MIDEAYAKALIRTVVDRLYGELQQGLDVSPGERLRFEGQVELLLERGLVDWCWLEALVSERYACYFLQPVDAICWEWMKADNRFHLPWKMQEAPVYKANLRDSQEFFEI